MEQLRQRWRHLVALQLWFWRWGIGLFAGGTIGLFGLFDSPGGWGITASIGALIALTGRMICALAADDLAVLVGQSTMRALTRRPDARETLVRCLAVDDPLDRVLLSGLGGAEPTGEPGEAEKTTPSHPEGRMGSLAPVLDRPGRELICLAAPDEQRRAGMSGKYRRQPGLRGRHPVTHRCVAHRHES